MLKPPSVIFVSQRELVELQTFVRTIESLLQVGSMPEHFEASRTAVEKLARRDPVLREEIDLLIKAIAIYMRAVDVMVKRGSLRDDVLERSQPVALVALRLREKMQMTWT